MILGFRLILFRMFDDVFFENPRKHKDHIGKKDWILQSLPICSIDFSLARPFY